MRASQEDRWKSARKESLRRLRKYEYFSQQQKRADQDAASEALKARKAARLRHDELMRKPWKRPGTPSKDILKRGDGVRRRRAALRRSIEKAAGQVDKMLPAMCRWHSGVPPKSSGLREFIDEQRAANRRSVCAAPQSETSEPSIPWNDVKATAQQHLQALVTGQRCHVQTGDPVDSRENVITTADELHGCLRDRPDVDQLSVSSNGLTIQSCICTSPGGQFVPANGASTIVHGEAQIGGSGSPQNGVGRICDIPLELPPKMADGSIMSKKASADSTDINVASRRRCTEVPPSTPCSLTLTFGDLLRQSMARMDPCDSQTQAVGKPTRPTELQDLAWTTQAASIHADSPEKVLPVHGAPLTDGGGCLLANSIVNCAEDMDKVKHVAEDKVRHDAKVTSSTELPTAMHGSGTGCHSNPISQGDSTAAGPHGSLAISSPAFGLQHAIHSRGHTSLSGASAPNFAPSSASSIHLSSQLSRESGQEQHMQSTCRLPRVLETMPSGLESAHGPASSCHANRLQQLMEKMESLQQLHWQVQQELQVSKRISDVKGTAQLRHTPGSGGLAPTQPTQPTPQSTKDLPDDRIPPSAEAAHSYRQSSVDDTNINPHVDDDSPDPDALDCGNVSLSGGEARPPDSANPVGCVHAISLTHPTQAPQTMDGGSGPAKQNWSRRSQLSESPYNIISQSLAAGRCQHTCIVQSPGAPVPKSDRTFDRIGLRKQPDHSAQDQCVQHEANKSSLTFELQHLALDQVVTGSGASLQANLKASMTDHENTDGQTTCAEASLRSWAAAHSPHDVALLQPMWMRPDSAMQCMGPSALSEGGHMEEAMDLSGSKIPCPPRPGSCKGASLAPIDPQAFSRIPGAVRPRGRCTQPLRSSFELEFQDLANDPEVLAMIHAHHRGQTRASEDTHSHHPSSGKLNSNRAHPNLALCHDSRDSNVAPCWLGDPTAIRPQNMKLKGPSSKGHVTGRHALTHESMNTSVSDEIAMLEASLERLDIQIANSKWPNVQYGAGSRQKHVPHYTGPPKVHRSEIPTIVQSTRQVRQVRGCNNNSLKQPAPAKRAIARAARNMHKGACKRQHTSQYGHGTGEDKNPESCHSVSSFTTASSVSRNAFLHGGGTAAHKPAQQQLKPAMAQEDAQQVWTQLLLAGVMATFGRTST
eukprot:jgi/Ulvmu1/8999/UM005_0090.1